MSEQNKASSVEAEPVGHIFRNWSNTIEFFYRSSLTPIDGNYFNKEFVESLPINESVPVYLHPAEPCSRCAELPPISDDVAALIERTDWTPNEALQFYADGKHFDTPNGVTRIIDTGAIASNALKHLSVDMLELKGDAELTELRSRCAELEATIAQQARQVEYLKAQIERRRLASAEQAAIIAQQAEKIARLRQDCPFDAIGKILTEVMDRAVENGANSVSMPDEYVAVAAWLCGVSAPAMKESKETQS